MPVPHRIHQRSVRRSIARIGSLACAVTLVTAAAGTATATAQPSVPKAENPLASTDIIAVMKEAESLIDTQVVGEAKQQARQYLVGTPAATTYSGKEKNLSDLPRYVDEMSLAQCIQVVNSDPDRPRISSTAMFGARYAQDNPDTAYRGAALAGDSAYKIHGKRNTTTYLAFQLVDGIYGENGQTPASLAVIDGTQLDVSPDGTFDITLDASPAEGRRNHIQLPADSRKLKLIVRDTYTDWNAVPAELTIDRISGPPKQPEASKQDKARRCADLIRAATPYWDGFMQRFHAPVPANTLLPIRPSTPGGLTGQTSTVGRFDLRPDQALVLTVDPHGAEYMGFQTGSDWYMSINYANHTSSLNNKQARPNPDGSITYVLSASDPGVANWIDTANHPTGLTQIRWHGLPQPIPAGYQPTARVVNLSELSSALPADTPTTTDRAAQIAERQSQVRARFDGIPPRLVPFDLATFEPLP
ncbi:hypothetical protein GCM10023094_50320 [Rhodococcus olei]|uniref:DUF1214 domain-containing protein n=1 Tax=Rhodococcus olei TaxID=2161675 RepID=A0ABP8PM80_9NOCA